MSALGHDVFFWSDFYCKQRTPEGLLSHNPELSLFGFFTYCNFFPNKISDLGNKGKISNLC